MIQNKKRIISLILMLTLLVSALVVVAVTASAAETYEKATSISVGDTVLLVCESKKMELNGISTTSTKYGIGVAYSTAPAGAYELTVEAGYNEGTYAFKTTDGKYLYWTSGNSLNVDSTLSAKTSWNVTFDANGNAIIKNANTTSRQIFWNASSPRFACYDKSGQTAVQLYKLVQNDTPPCEHTNKVSHSAVEATCTTTGNSKYWSCPDCKNFFSDEACTTVIEKDSWVTDKIDHNYVNGTCSACGAEEPNEVVFDFGANGSAVHVDGNDLANNTTYTEGNYTLTLTNVSKVYGPAYDAKGNSCIKLGTVSAAGKISFTVPSDVKSVIINVAGYKDSKADVSVNGTKETITTVSNNGAYTAIEVDTSTNKTVSFSTVSNGYRAMINSIVFVLEESDCEHDYVGVETKAPTCTETGVTTYTCSKCEDAYTEAIATIAHSYDEGVETTPASCTAPGVKTYTCTSANCGNSYTEAIEMISHSYNTEGICVCGKIDPRTVDYSGTYFIAALRNESYWYMTNDLGTASAKRYQAVDSGLISLPEAVCTHDHVFVLERDDNGTYCISTIVDETVKYITWTSGNTGTLTDDKENALKLDVIKQEDGTFTISFDNYVNNENTMTGYLSLNDDYKQGYDYFAFYKDEIKNLSLVPVGHSATCGHVAELNGEVYTSIKDAINAAENGDTITLIKDVVLAESIKISSEVTIDLKGYSITTQYDAHVVEIFYVDKNGVLTIKGDGKFYASMLENATATEYVGCISAVNGGMVTIENGTFISDGCTAIYATRGGSVTINGGYYEAKELYNGMNFLIDINEAEEVKGVITISGGTFVDFNPANHNNDGKGYTNKVDEGYAVVQNGNEYTVKELDDVIGAPVDGKITLDSDITIIGNLVINEDLVIDLNGHVLEATGLVTFAADAIIDSSAKWENDEFVEPTGLLIIPQFKIVIPTPGLYMPIWNTVNGVSGYQFVEMEDQQKVVDTVPGDDSFNVVFRPSIGDTAFNNKIFGDVVNNGLEFVINVYNGTLVDGEFVAAEGTPISGMLDPETVATAYEGNAVKAVNVKFTGADFTDGNCYSIELFIRIKTLDENGTETYINAYYTVLAVVGAEGEI